LQQLGVERSRNHGFGDEVIHACREAGAAILVEGIGGHGYNRQVGKGGLGSNLPGCLQAVHLRHLHIHQHEVVAIHAKLFEGYATGLRRVHGQTDCVQQFECYFPVYCVVLRQQDAGTALHTAQHAFEVSERLLGFGGRWAMAALKSHGEPEGAPLARGAIGACIAAHQACQAVGDG
jgi:hypothetical protein